MDAQGRLVFMVLNLEEQAFSCPLLPGARSRRRRPIFLQSVGVGLLHRLFKVVRPANEDILETWMGAVFNRIRRPCSIELRHASELPCRCSLRHKRMSGGSDPDQRRRKQVIVWTGAPGRVSPPLHWLLPALALLLFGIWTTSVWLTRDTIPTISI